MSDPLLSRRDRVLQIVANTEGIRWWIDKQIADGKTDDEIAAGLPLAIAFITGKLSEAELRAPMTRELENRAILAYLSDRGPTGTPWKDLPEHERAKWLHRTRPRPDFDPHIDYPERYTDGPI